MSKSDFGHLATYNPEGRTADYILPIRARLRGSDETLIQPVLTMRNAGQSNRKYFNAQASRNAKTGQTRRLAQGRIDSDIVDQNRKQDRELFPKYVITDWKGVYDSSFQPVEFNEDNCKAFLNNLPDWMMDDVRNFAAVPANFLDDDEPTEGDILETAGN